jgi:hypothetical protein
MMVKSATAGWENMKNSSYSSQQFPSVWSNGDALRRTGI